MNVVPLSILLTSSSKGKDSAVLAMVVDSDGRERKRALTAAGDCMDPSGSVPGVRKRCRQRTSKDASQGGQGGLSHLLIVADRCFHTPSAELKSNGVETVISLGKTLESTVRAVSSKLNPGSPPPQKPL